MWVLSTSSFLKVICSIRTQAEVISEYFVNYAHYLFILDHSFELLALGQKVPDSFSLSDGFAFLRIFVDVVMTDII